MIGGLIALGAAGIIAMNSKTIKRKCANSRVFSLLFLSSGVLVILLVAFLYLHGF